MEHPGLVLSTIFIAKIGSELEWGAWFKQCNQLPLPTPRQVDRMEGWRNRIIDY